VISTVTTLLYLTKILEFMRWYIPVTNWKELAQTLATYIQKERKNK